MIGGSGARFTRSPAEALIGLLVSAGAVALVTAVIALLKPHVPLLSLGALYLFAVLPVAVVWGIAFAVPVAIASMLAFNWFYLPPTHTFTLTDSRHAARCRRGTVPRPRRAYLRELTGDGETVVNAGHHVALHGWRRLLHNQRALYIKRILLFEPRVILSSVTYQLT